MSVRAIPDGGESLFGQGVHDEDDNGGKRNTRAISGGIGMALTAGGVQLFDYLSDMVVVLQWHRDGKVW